jgi:hypothetical protein
MKRPLEAHALKYLGIKKEELSDVLLELLESSDMTTLTRAQLLHANIDALGRPGLTPDTRLRSTRGVLVSRLRRELQSLAQRCCSS